MLSIRNLVVAVSTVAVVFSFANTSNAQRAPLKVNQAFRWMGHFQSTGYHWRTPGPCVGYYNPYSHHNTSLKIGGHPQGAGSYDLDFYSDHNSGVYSEFDRPGNFTGPVAPSTPPPNDAFQSEVENEQYRQDKTSTKKGADEDTQSILDEIEAIDDQENGPDKTKKRVDGASIWSDVFELSRINRQKNSQRRASNSLKRTR